MVKAIIFDLDGTLIDSAQDVRCALNKLLMAHKCQEIAYENIYDYIKQGARWLIKNAFIESGRELNDNEVHALIEEYLANYQENPIAQTKIYPGVKETLLSFKKNGKKLGICTNKPSIMTRIILEKLQLSSFFEAVVAAEDTSLLKPHPEHIYATLSKMNVKPTCPVVMVGDSDHDIIAAKHAGIPVIAATYGYFGAHVESLNPDASINDFFSLPMVLGKLFNNKE